MQTALEPNAIGIGLLLQHGVKIRPEAGGHFRGAARRAVAVHTATQREADLTIAAIAAETGLSRYLVRALLIEQGVIKRPQHRSAR
ncbi:hypothetical protein AF335_06140 [Streptomyces eurocidicus]|uniref:HTH iclR-type domain-containing protein n=1 Tax=Streptomyces eurocidicus TaxID=66423 RepID=A0A2N8NZN3_STREU|nr:hypothetical protein AF335_06140 [Streptomyces eurocidicus]